MTRVTSFSSLNVKVFPLSNRNEIIFLPRYGLFCLKITRNPSLEKMKNASVALVMRAVPTILEVVLDFSMT